NTLQIWTRETNDLGYFSVLSNYSFNAQQYHIEVVTSTTSLTQNSSTTYLIPDYDFPPNFDETVLWTKMDKGSGTNVSDSSGNGHHGTAMNGVGWTTGINGSALDFENSSSHYVNFTDSDDFSFSDGAGNDLAFTIEFWLKLESGDRSQYVIAKWDHVGDNREYRIWIGSDNKLYVRLFNNDSADYIGRASSVALATGSWYYLVLVYDGSESDTGFALYLNGTLDSSSTSSSSGSYVGMTNGDDELEFGRTLTGYFLDGILDDVRIHKNLTLSASQIAARFTNYSYYDPTRGEYYIYSSSSTSKSIEQKSYFTPLNITSTASITYSESETYFLLQSTNETLLSRVWFNGTYSGDYFIGQFIPKNTSLGTHNFSFVTFMADQQYVYLPTSLTSYIYTVTLAFAVYIENFYLTDENCYLYMIANKAGSYTIYENDSSVGSGSFTTTGTNIAHTRNQAYGVVIFLSYKFTSVSEILWFNTSYINTASVAWAVTTLLFSYDLESNYIYVTYYSTWANTTYRVSDNDTSLGNLVNEGSSSWSFTDDAGYHIINISIYNSALFLQNFTYGFTIIDDFSVSIENFYLTDKNCYLYVTATRDGSFEIYENDTLQSSGSFLKTGTNIAHTRNQAAGIVVFLSYKFMSGSDIQWFNTTYINTESIPWEVDVLFFTYDIDYGIISTTYISNWANTTYRMADNGTWLGSAQSEGSHTWTFDITSGYHNITLTAYNGAVVLDTIEFAISIPLTPWEVDVLVFTYDASFGIISTTYISNWANTTHRLADNGTWLASAQVEGSFTWPFTTTVGYHNITMHVYNGVIELDVIEFGFTILPTLVYWQVFFTFVDQNNLPLFFQFGKIYVNGSQQLSQYLTILDGSVINVNITDNFNQNLLNQSYTVTSDLTISVEVTVYLMYFLNSGSYPGEVVVYKDAIAGYNFSIPSLGNQPLYFLAGNYLYQVYYRTVSVQAGVTIVASAKTAYGDLRKFSVGEDYSQYVDASTPRKPSDTTETPVSAFAGTVTQLFSFIIILLVGGFGIVLIRGRSKVVVKEKEVIKGENK
ncbi:MAG: LamG domain-containing protein, partial [Candidatus Hermodarchaeota archaeon]